MSKVKIVWPFPPWIWNDTGEWSLELYFSKILFSCFLPLIIHFIKNCLNVRWEYFDVIWDATLRKTLFIILAERNVSWEGICCKTSLTSSSVASLRRLFDSVLGSVDALPKSLMVVSWSLLLAFFFPFFPIVVYSGTFVVLNLIFFVHRILKRNSDSDFIFYLYWKI